MQNTRWVQTYKKKYSTTNLFRNNREVFQKRLSEPTALTCHKKYCPKRIPNAGKYSGQSLLLAKF